MQAVPVVENGPKWAKVKSMLCELPSKITAEARKRKHSLLSSSSDNTSTSDDELTPKQPTYKEAEDTDITIGTQTMVHLPCNVNFPDPMLNVENVTKPEVAKITYSMICTGNFIPGTSYMIGKVLGQGGYGKVYLATKDNIQYAIKVKDHEKKHQREDNMHERNVMRKIAMCHSIEFLVHCFGTIQHGPYFCFVMEKMDLSLHNFLSLTSHRPFQVETVKYMTNQLLSAVTCLLQIGYIHADIKPANILFCNIRDSSDPWKIKLCDFGLAVPSNIIRNYGGPMQTVNYSAPETILGLPKCECVDCWSIGCVIFKMYTGFDLFTSRDEIEMLRQYSIVTGLPENFENGRHTDKYYKIDENGELQLRQSSSTVQQPMKYTEKGFDNVGRIGHSYLTTGSATSLDAEIITLIECLVEPNPSKRLTVAQSIDFLNMMSESTKDQC